MKLKMNGFVIMFIILIMILSVLISGCSNNENNDAEIMDVTIAVNRIAHSGAIYVAKEKGFFGNLNVTIQEFTSGKDALNSLLEGNADLATTSETAFMHAILKGEKIYTLATLVTSYKQVAMVTNKNKISFRGDLQDKKIGIVPGTSAEYFLDNLLALEGLSKDNIKIINLKPENMLKEMQEGNVDAVVIWQPHVLLLEEVLGDKVKSYYATEAGGFTLDWNLVVQQDYVKQNHDLLIYFMQGLINAEDFIVRYPEESKMIIAEKINIDENTLSLLWESYEFHSQLEQSYLITLEDKSRWAIKNNYTQAREVPNYLDYIYFDILDSLDPGAITIVR